MQASLYANDINDFADKILDLLDDDELRLKMGQYGYDRVISELSWDHESEKLIKFYEKVFSSEK